MVRVNEIVVTVHVMRRWIERGENGYCGLLDELSQAEKPKRNSVRNSSEFKLCIVRRNKGKGFLFSENFIFILNKKDKKLITCYRRKTRLTKRTHRKYYLAERKTKKKWLLGEEINRGIQAYFFRD